MSSVPQQRGGWWHDYVCPTHGVELDTARGDTFPCRYGCEFRGGKFAAAWLVYEHQGLAREARLRARRFAAHGDAADRDRVLVILQDYAALYDTVVRAGWNDGSEAWMLKGKLFSQALTEAQWAVQIADAVIALGAELNQAADAAAITAMLRGLLETTEAARVILVDERDDESSNYTAWLNAAGRLLSRALTACGAGDDAAEAVWLTRTYSHIRLAIASDGWEWEGSTYYHLFVLRAYLLGLAGAEPASLPEDVRATLGAMTTVLAELAAPSGQLPSLHDGPYDRAPMNREVLEVAALSGQLFAETGLDAVANYAHQQLGADDDGLESMLPGWFSGPALPALAPSRGSVLFDQVGYAVLRDEGDQLTAILDVGPHGGAHGHLDKLGLYLYGTAPWQPAPGVPPYGSALRREYYATSTAHPTLTVDGRDQAEGTAVVDLWDAAAGRVVAHTVDAIPGVLFRRDVSLVAGHLVDIVTASAADGEEHRFALNFRPSHSLTVVATEAGARSTWTNDAGVTLSALHAASGANAFELVATRAPSDDPARVVAGADWHHRGVSACFVSVYRLGGDAHAAITIPEDGPAVVTLSLPDGTTHTIEAFSA